MIPEDTKNKLVYLKDFIEAKIDIKNILGFDIPDYLFELIQSIPEDVMKKYNITKESINNFVDYLKENIQKFNFIEAATKLLPSIDMSICKDIFDLLLNESYTLHQFAKDLGANESTFDEIKDYLKDIADNGEINITKTIEFFQKNQNFALTLISKIIQGIPDMQSLNVTKMQLTLKKAQSVLLEAPHLIEKEKKGLYFSIMSFLVDRLDKNCFDDIFNIDFEKVIKYLNPATTIKELFEMNIGKDLNEVIDGLKDVRDRKSVV